ncbi:hypothetical protein GTU79_14215 [Sodalis ligni]|uniref:hypothetical protein n=1 Tax=Sodalis ligni TaxID=2697027 RepID=UPI001BDEFCD3|nr:hypothetical protein [Sodalis ligni]QWA13621.1 hypothetical protein GTU79_14215 [Sodalis ligni]
MASKIEAVRDQASPDFNQNNLEMFKNISIWKRKEIYMFYQGCINMVHFSEKTLNEGFYLH